MALIKFGSFVTDGRGKIGGHVLSSGRSGAILRTKVTPLNPQTTFQQAARARLGSLSTQWRNLTEDQRIAWNNAVENFLNTNVFGDSVRPTGKNLFTGLNINLLILNRPIINDPPLPVSVTAADISNLVGTAGVPSLSFDFANGNSNQQLLVSSTSGLSAGVFFVNSEFRVLLNAGMAFPGSLNILTAWNGKFGSLVAGTKVFIKAIPINRNTGQAGVAEILSVIVAA